MIFSNEIKDVLIGATGMTGFWVIARLLLRRLWPTKAESEATAASAAHEWRSLANKFEERLNGLHDEHIQLYSDYGKLSEKFNNLEKNYGILLIKNKELRFLVDKMEGQNKRLLERISCLEAKKKDGL